MIFLSTTAWPLTRPGGFFARSASNGVVTSPFLLLVYPASLLVGWKLGMLNRDNILPLHLCDVAAICGAGALWFRHQRLTELVWFWGLAGTMNGLITPALSESFPSPRFVSFFALHSGVVIAAGAGRGLPPSRPRR